MRRAPALGLHENVGVRQKLARLDCHGRLARTNDDRDRIRLTDRSQRVGQERRAAEPVQHLRPERAHARALAGGEHDREAGPIGHQSLRERIAGGHTGRRGKVEAAALSPRFSRARQDRRILLTFSK